MHDVAIDMWRQALITAAWVGAPFLAAGVIVGVVMALLQAATQIQENSLSFVPKVVVVGLLLAISGPWFLERLTTFSQASMARVAEVGRGAVQQ